MSVLEVVKVPLVGKPTNPRNVNITARLMTPRGVELLHRARALYPSERDLQLLACIEVAEAYGWPPEWLLSAVFAGPEPVRWSFSLQRKLLDTRKLLFAAGVVLPGQVMLQTPAELARVVRALASSQ